MQGIRLVSEAVSCEQKLGVEDILRCVVEGQSAIEGKSGEDVEDGVGVVQGVAVAAAHGYCGGRRSAGHR
jgi:hypothetical protein